MLQYKNANSENYKKLEKLVKAKEINDMYEEAISKGIDVTLIKTYNNMGTRYKNDIKKLNDVPEIASKTSITFSGYTGPMFTIDFEKKRIVLIMCNVLHNTKLTRERRKEKTFEIMNFIFENLEGKNFSFLDSKLKKI